jgi:hypothetical protein
VTAGADLDLEVSLRAGLGSLVQGIGLMNDKLEREWRFRQKAAQATRQIPFVINLPIASSAGNFNPVPGSLGPDIGYYWSIRRLSATGFTAGQVNLYIDSVNGEPLWTFTGSAVGIYVQNWGKGHQMVHPGSTLAISATGITGGPVVVYGSADQFESWLLPFYMGSVR